MYGIDGRRNLAETTLDDLTGYRGARPVRVGNGAFDQRQNDVFGAVLDSILLHTRRSARLPRGLWPIVQSQAACATEVWREPDQGIWEARGQPQHYVSSKLMCWVALDRAAKLAEIRGDADLAATWQEVADEIKADILAHGVDDRGVLRQHYDTDALDASTLLAALFGFLPGDDERLHKSILAIADELSDHGFVLRYRTDETDDGLSGKEGTFLICSFWLVSALSIVGEAQRARRPDGAPPAGRLAPRALRRGVRRRHRAPPRQLPAGVLAPGADRGRGADHPAGAHGGADMSDGDYDVIIIGTGAGGGTLARHLAPSGQRILLLERGDWLPREPQNWSAQDVFVDSRYISPDTWYDAKGKAFQPQVHYFVGGATKLYGAALYRLRHEDFGELRHHDGISPAWPISYDEMEPYYTLAEQHYDVHGARGEDPTEPPASAPYPYPALSHEPRIQQLSDDLAAAGYHPFHAPCGVMLDESNRPDSTCVRCGFCDGFPCPLHAKSDAEVHGVRPALEHPNVTLLTNATVVRLDTNPAGTAVTEVEVDQAGERTILTAHVVVVSCGAANTAKLLLGSANDRHPNGLANGSDQVGRNYMFHNSQAVLALSHEPNPTVFQKTLGVNDFYFGTDDFEYPMGNIQMVGKSTEEMYRGEKPIETKLAPTLVLSDIASHAVDFWLSTEDLPQPENRVTLERDGSVKLSYEVGNQAASNRLYHAAQVDARPPGPAPGPPDPPARLPEDRHPRGRRCPPGRHLSVRHGRRDVGPGPPTARRTSWTTSTSSTRASSRASGR